MNVLILINLIVLYFQNNVDIKEHQGKSSDFSICWIPELWLLHEIHVLFVSKSLTVVW